jgi:hypothetical protein
VPRRTSDPSVWRAGDSPPAPARLRQGCSDVLDRHADEAESGSNEGEPALSALPLGILATGVAWLFIAIWEARARSR